ncbi:MAG: branched-chain amino acid ABC transporter permease [Deltaproteobacteria bacterium]|nr:branched-chain amino acid ABC transporter permease [Deltaproteobacteria bacterium]
MQALKDRGHPLGLLALLAAIVAVPWALPNEYYLTVLIVGGFHVIAALGLNLLLGFAGQISLGHAAFYGLSAYTTGILTGTYQWPVLGGAAAALGLVLAVSLLIGAPTLKLKGHYLAMGTLGFGVIVYIVLNETMGLTGGPSGFTGIPKFNVAGWQPSSDRQYYYLIWGVAFVLFVLAQNLVRSRLGRALRAIHTSEAAASVLGIDVSRYKLFVFVLSALYAAVAGILYAHYVTFVSPGSFGFGFSVELVTMVVLGGMGSLWGALMGALFLTGLPEVLRAVENFDVLVYGAVLLLCMMFFPGGFAEGFQKVGHALGRLFGRAAVPAGGDPLFAPRAIPLPDEKGAQP